MWEAVMPRQIRTATILVASSLTLRNRRVRPGWAKDVQSQIDALKAALPMFAIE
jgi:hypothetical protein